jgi:hypothetical protein
MRSEVSVSFSKTMFKVTGDEHSNDIKLSKEGRGSELLNERLSL